MQRSTQRLRKTDRFLLAGFQRIDARARRHLKWKFPPPLTALPFVCAFSRGLFRSHKMESLLAG